MARAPLRLGLLAAVLWPFAAVALGVGCGRARVPECPSGRWCGSLEQVEPLSQTKERVLTCPMYVGWAASVVGAGDAGAAPAELPGAGEGTIDLESTRKRRVAGSADACCYHWFASCPVTMGETPKPPARPDVKPLSDGGAGG